MLHPKPMMASLDVVAFGEVVSCAEQLDIACDDGCAASCPRDIVVKVELVRCATNDTFAGIAFPDL